MYIMFVRRLQQLTALNNVRTPGLFHGPQYTDLWTGCRRQWRPADVKPGARVRGGASTLIKYRQTKSYGNRATRLWVPGLHRALVNGEWPHGQRLRYRRQAAWQSQRLQAASILLIQAVLCAAQSRLKFKLFRRYVQWKTYRKVFTHPFQLPKWQKLKEIPFTTRLYTIGHIRCYSHGRHSHPHHGIGAGDV